MRVVPELWTAVLPPRESPRYERRDPEATVLHRVVRERLERFVAEAEEAGRPIPPWRSQVTWAFGSVEQEFRDYSKCGVLAHG